MRDGGVDPLCVAIIAHIEGVHALNGSVIYFTRRARRGEVARRGMISREAPSAKKRCNQAKKLNACGANKLHSSRNFAPSRPSRAIRKIPPPPPRPCPGVTVTIEENRIGQEGNGPPRGGPGRAGCAPIRRGARGSLGESPGGLVDDHSPIGSASSPSGEPTIISSATWSVLPRIAASSRAAWSGFSLSHVLAFSRPCPMRIES